MRTRGLLSAEENGTHGACSSAACCRTGLALPPRSLIALSPCSRDLGETNWKKRAWTWLSRPTTTWREEKTHTPGGGALRVLQAHRYTPCDIDDDVDGGKSIGGTGLSLSSRWDTSAPDRWRSTNMADQDEIDKTRYVFRRFDGRRRSAPFPPPLETVCVRRRRRSRRPPIPRWSAQTLP